MSSPSPLNSPPANVTSPPPPPPPTETTPTPVTPAAPAPSNTTQTTVPSPPPPTTTTVPSDSPPPPPPPPATETAGSSPATQPPPESGDSTNGSAGLIVGVVIGGLGMLVVIGIFFCYRRWKRRKMTLEHGAQPPPQHPPKNGNFGVPPIPMQSQNNPPPDNAHYAMSPASSVPMSNYPYSSGPDRPAPATPQSPQVVFGLSRSEFSYEELRTATGGFSRENILGQGGFGYVYKGILPNGKVVAVKQLKAGSGQGEREFQAEVEVISRVHHRHLVSLVGYCISGTQRMLVYEFVPNGTLEYHLHGKGKPPMKWAMRMKMALGSAKGLAYLHEDCQPKIIHRDIKAANILVDKEFEAKVADFGLAKFSLDTETHVSTRIMGTFGYLAPEYASTGKLTDKSDVFSFGVVLLELITGRYPIDKNNPSDESMVEWARPLLRQAMESGNFDCVVDPKLQNEYKDNEMKRMIACAAACVRHSARIRPRMSQIARALEGNLPLDELSEGVQPGHSSVYSQGSQDYNTREYKQDLERFRKLALESQEQAPGEYSAPSTSSGLNTSVWSSITSDAQHTSGEVDLNYNNRNQNLR